MLGAWTSGGHMCSGRDKHLTSRGKELAETLLGGRGRKLGNKNVGHCDGQTAHTQNESLNQIQFSSNEKKTFSKKKLAVKKWIMTTIKRPLKITPFNSSWYK